MIDKRLYGIVKDINFLNAAKREIKKGGYGYELRPQDDGDVQLWTGDPAFNGREFLITSHQAGLLKK